jgi:hypothetical protein
MSILNARRVTSNQAGSFLDVSLGEILRLSKCFQALANNRMNLVEWFA